ncbi:MAG: hypothetical protein IPK53_08595 [bacterium]|nr:hypothetical protein [bacterium]
MNSFVATIGAAAGYVAAAVHIYAPYTYNMSIQLLAARYWPKAFSLGVFPLALWGLERLRRRQRAVRRWATTAFAPPLLFES